MNITTLFGRFIIHSIKTRDISNLPRASRVYFQFQIINLVIIKKLADWFLIKPLDKLMSPPIN